MAIYVISYNSSMDLIYHLNKDFPLSDVKRVEDLSMFRPKIVLSSRHKQPSRDHYRKSAWSYGAIQSYACSSKTSRTCLPSARRLQPLDGQYPIFILHSIHQGYLSLLCEEKFMGTSYRSFSPFSNMFISN